jgi:parallel beta-helix repeat protein
MKWKVSAAIFFAAVAVLGWAASAGAVDGTIEINQAKVLAGSGFPFSIGAFASRSYRLTGDLTVVADKDAIDVNAAGITIDLNGFSITGPGSSSAAIGINASTNGGVTVENGTVTGFGTGVTMGANGIVKNVHADANGSGISVGNDSVVEGCTANLNSVGNGIQTGNNAVIKDCTANSNGSDGITAGANSRVQGCTANNSTGTGSAGIGIFCPAGPCAISGNTANGNSRIGIFCEPGCVISGNTASTNARGIVCSESVISGNSLENNTTSGLETDSFSGFVGNVLNNTTNFSGPKSLGGNLCGGTLC